MPDPTLTDPTEDEADFSKAQNKYTKWTEAGNLAEAVGRGAAARKARKRAERVLARNPGFDPEGLDFREFDEYSDFAPGNADNAYGGVRQLAKRKFRGADDKARAMNRWGIGMNNAMEGVMEDQHSTALREEIDPSLEAAQQRMDELASQDAISATQEQEMRSNIASQIQQQKASKLATVAATMGLGGMENSPAAAALAAEAADDADRSLVGTLRDMGLQVSELNRHQARLDTDLATRIASQRYAVLHGNADELIRMRGDIASTLDALYSRDRTMEMMREQIDQADQDPGWLDYATGTADMLKGVSSAYQGFSSGGGGGGESGMNTAGD